MKQPFESDFWAIPLINPRAGQVFVDIWANWGQSAQEIRMFDKITPIHCFEPGKGNFSILQHYTKKMSDVFLHNTGLGDKPGTMTLYTPIYRGYRFDGLASVFREEAVDWLNADTIIGFTPSCVRVVQECIEIVVLDALALDPCFIKIDVQCAELEVIRGAQNTIARSRPILLIEIPINDEAIDILRNLGFSMFVFGDGRFATASHASRNCFFIHEENFERLGITRGATLQD